MAMPIRDGRRRSFPVCSHRRCSTCTRADRSSAGMTSDPTKTAWPKIDVVTVCRNAVSIVESTIVSVVSQSVLPNRYIVIDGASTDGTQQVIEKYGGRLTEFISEPDSGIAQAMNKALALSDGDYVLFLHAGDRLIDESSFADVSHVFERVQPDILACPIILEVPGSEILASPRGFGPWMRLKTGLFHQGTLCARQLFASIGGFDESLKIAMDYDFFLRAYLAGATIFHHSAPFSYMASGGISCRRDWPSLKARLDEELLIHMRYATSSTARVSYGAYWLMYPAYKRIMTYLHRSR